MAERNKRITGQEQQKRSMGDAKFQRPIVPLGLSGPALKFRFLFNRVSLS